MNKYGAKRTWSELCNRTFASKAECIRGEELALLERAGEISDLRYQVRFILSKDPKVSITIDFSYLEDARRLDNKPLICCRRIFEDVKGVLTRDFRTKLAWLKEKHNIDVVLINR